MRATPESLWVALEICTKQFRHPDQATATVIALVLPHCCKPIQCVQDMRATLESLWVALVNMYNTDTNKKHCNRLLDIHGGFSRAASVAPPHQF